MIQTLRPSIPLQEQPPQISQRSRGRNQADDRKELTAVLSCRLSVVGFGIGKLWRRKAVLRVNKTVRWDYLVALLSGRNAAAMAACNATQLRLLLDHGARIIPGAPVLAAACSCEFHPCTECARMFIDAGADINAAAWDGTTPLMIVLRSPEVAVVKHHLSRGADVKARDTSGDGRRNVTGAELR